MDQYWLPVNLDKREFVNPHKLATGLKLWEQLANHPGTGAALIVLCAAMPEPRGGGDFGAWEGPVTPPAEDCSENARRIIGRWAGDRVALVGDYAEDNDLFDCGVASMERDDDPPFSSIYGECGDEGSYTDISEDVCRVIEHELGGKHQGTGWRSFVRE